MKQFVKILLVISIIGSAAVSMLIMSHNGDCLMSYSAGAACPQSNVLAYIGLHVNFLKNFSDAVLIVFSSIILIGAAFLISSDFYLDRFSPNKNFYIKSLFRAVSFKKQKQVIWLSLFENSPNVLLSAKI